MRSTLVRHTILAVLLIGLGNQSRTLAQQPRSGPTQSLVRMTRDSFGGANVIRHANSSWPRLTAEFEATNALLLSISDWHPQHRPILQEIAIKTAGHCPLVLLCADSVAIRETTLWLAEIGRELPDVYFCPMPTDTVWVRDFGPIFVQTRNASRILDFFYLGERPLDDRLPTDWAAQSGVESVPVHWTIQGGNLMPNGRGLALTTNRIFDDNHIEFPEVMLGQDVEYDRRHIVAEAIADACNLQQLVVLEPLANEETRHVDMFTTFLTPDTLLVASVDPATDPENAAILDRNVERLQNVRVAGRPLDVQRIAIPTRNGNAWSAYTNAILANDLVLVPVIETDPPTLIRDALQTYRELLPGHHVETINMSSMRDLQGELHCLSMHIPRIARMPNNLYGFESALKFYFPDGILAAE
ncbi:agmatine deiminase family protein [Aporhodopirellula aestuarii]|uniref:Agmatine deiminase family protein n=1 Tax=Aporhodopirellula aestuarii TaxID=2950107 RepID=A0ABT0TYB8_9BACT|nr:agmatine deiminase family protein [Aporhodopirellula aestuarii]MCM2369560.1 agmatine deiminase family protein [Aporhodopirellula aestuarii]